MTVRVLQVPSPKHFAGRLGQAVIALVHHRMVGTLYSTDATFTTGTRQASTNFGVGYNCGRTGHPTGLAGAHVHQYVMVDDAAWGNGNLDLTGQWDEAYGAAPNPNYRTISIEHHDNGGLPLGEGRGVVPPGVIAVSIELDKLLLSGDWPAWKAAGIQANSDGAGASIAAQVREIKPSATTIIDHNFIAGNLKPYCWRPWADDGTGFPQAQYLAELNEQETNMDTGVKLVSPPIGAFALDVGHALISVEDTAYHFPYGTWPGRRTTFPVGASLNLVRQLDGAPVDIEGNSPPLGNRDQVYLVSDPDFGSDVYALRQDGVFTPAADATPVTQVAYDSLLASYDALGVKLQAAEADKAVAVATAIQQTKASAVPKVIVEFPT